MNDFYPSFKMNIAIFLRFKCLQSKAEIQFEASYHVEGDQTGSLCQSVRWCKSHPGQAIILGLLCLF